MQTQSSPAGSSVKTLKATSPSIIMLTCAEGLVMVGEAFKSGQATLRTSSQHFGIAVHGLSAERTDAVLALASSWWHERGGRLTLESAREFGRDLAADLRADESILMFVGDAQAQMCASIRATPGEPEIVLSPFNARADVYAAGPVMDHPKSYSPMYGFIRSHATADLPSDDAVSIARVVIRSIENVLAGTAPAIRARIDTVILRAVAPEPLADRPLGVTFQ